MAADLAPVYLDDARVTLQGDPRPQVAKILQAGGRPLDVRVVLEGRQGRPLSPEEVLDRTGNPAEPLHLRTAVAGSASAPAASPDASAERQPLPGDEAIGGVGHQGAFQSAKPGHVQTPGDILRGTETRAESSEESARAGRPTPEARFAEAQSFGDPAHKGGSPRVARDSEPSSPVPPGHIADGGLRTQETAREEGGRTPRPTSTTTMSRESLRRVSQED